MRATHTRQTVCDPDRQAETQRHEKGLTFIIVEDTTCYHFEYILQMTIPVLIPFSKK